MPLYDARKTVRYGAESTVSGSSLSRFPAVRVPAKVLRKVASIPWLAQLSSRRQRTYGTTISSESWGVVYHWIFPD